MTSVGYPSVTGQRIEAGTVDKHLSTWIADFGFTRVLLVTGNKSFEWFEKKSFTDSISAIASVRRWAVTFANPDITQLREGLKFAQGYNPDLVIGIGGGSALDMAKLIAALLDCPQEIEGIFAGGAKLDTRSTSLLLVPTTAGSGAEATHFSVLYKEKVKYSVAGRALLADHVALDPELLRTGQPAQLAASGLDTLCQCIESLWSRRATPISIAFAGEGLRFSAENLVPFAQGEFQRAAEMQWASHLSGKAINISQTTGPHALAYYLTGKSGLPHGIAVASTIGHFIDHHNKRLRESSPISAIALRESMGIVNKELGLQGEHAGRSFFDHLFSQLGLNQPQSYWPAELKSRREWISSANPERLKNHPTDLPDLTER